MMVRNGEDVSPAERVGYTSYERPINYSDIVRRSRDALREYQQQLELQSYIATRRNRNDQNR